MSTAGNHADYPRPFTDADLWGRDGKPGANDVQQKNIGDCYLVAVAGMVAEQTPHIIRNAIDHDQKTGNFTVKLFENGKRSVIQVTQEELQNNLLERGGSSFGSKSNQVDGGLWPAVIEIGYAKLKWGDWETGLQKLDKGGDPAVALEAITGKKPMTLDAEAVSRTEMREIAGQINAALEDGKRVMMATNEDPSVGRALLTALVFPAMAPRILHDLKQAKTDSDGVAGNHVYMVMGARFDPEANDSLIRVRNPWGQNRVNGQWGRHEGEWSDSAEIEVSLRTMLEEQTRSLNRFDIGQVPAQQRELFDGIRKQADGASDAAIALAAVQASREGITSVDKLRAVTVSDDGKLWVAGNIPGYRTAVDMTVDLPPVEESLQGLALEAQRLHQDKIASQQDLSASRHV